MDASCAVRAEEARPPFFVLWLASSTACSFCCFCFSFFLFFFFLFFFCLFLCFSSSLLSFLMFPPPRLPSFSSSVPPAKTGPGLAWRWCGCCCNFAEVATNRSRSMIKAQLGVLDFLLRDIHTLATAVPSLFEQLLLLQSCAASPAGGPLL